MKVLQEDSSYAALGIDKANDVLYSVPGDGALVLSRLDGTEAEVNDYTGTPGWYTGDGSLLPDGRVVGYKWWTGVTQTQMYRAFMWDGQAHLLRAAGSYSSHATDSNARGTIVGFSKQVMGDPSRAVVWRTADSKMRRLPAVPGYTETLAYRIDNENRISGAASGPGLAPVRVVWSQGQATVIHFPSRFDVSDAYAGYASTGFAAGSITRKDGTRVPAIDGPDGLVSLPISSGWTGRLSMVTPKGRYAGTITDAQGNDHTIVGRYGTGYHVLPTPPDAQLVAFHDFDSGTALFQGRDSWDVITASCLDGA